MAASTHLDADGRPTSGGLGVTLDGRRARGERNRDAVADALLDLMRERGEIPSASAIAERAGVSLRSVFRHFDDLDALHAAAVERHFVRVAHLYELPPLSRDLDERIDAVTRARARLWEEATPVRRLAEQVQRSSPSIRDGLDAARRFTRTQILELFADELDPLDVATRRLLVDAIEMATSWTVWNQLREHQGCSVARSESLVALTLHGHLDSFTG